MPANSVKRLAQLLDKHFERILSDWIRAQADAGLLRPELMSESEIRRQSRAVLTELVRSLRQCESVRGMDLESEIWSDTRSLLQSATDQRVERGFTPTEMAMFILALKQPIFERLRDEYEDDPGLIANDAWESSWLLDQLGLYTSEVYLEERQEIIERQQREMIELSTPVVQLWDRILALPLIGTLDSVRAQMVMENLLQAIVEREAEFAIIDITGVPTVDTLVAQNLLKTAAATKLMGAICIISGIRPQIAQTIVHLGVDLPDVITKADLQSALAYALSATGVTFSPGARSRG